VAKGLLVQNDTLFAASSLGLALFDLETGALLLNFNIPSQVGPNDVTADTSGNVYVSDAQGDMIHRVHIADMSTEVIVSGFTMANGLLFDPELNRILACQWINNSPISSISLPGYAVSVAASDGLDLLDGLTRDGEGNIYVSSFQSDAIFRYDRDFSEGPELVSTNHVDPGDIYYCLGNDTLIVPNINGQKVDFVDLTTDLELVNYHIDDSSGDNNGLADPGEIISLLPVVYNHGQTAGNTIGELVAIDDTYITISAATTSFDTIVGLNRESTALLPMILSIDSTCPNPYWAELELHLAADDGYSHIEAFCLYIGDVTGWEEDVEGATACWSHRRQTRHYVDEWHVSSSRSHSADYSWKSGGNGLTDYANMSDGGLVTPPVLLEKQSALSFRYWISAEQGTESTAWDGGTVMLSRVGEVEWSQIDPTGGYPMTIINNPASPLERGTGCFSGSEDWTEVYFDLTEFTGMVQLMFRFGSDGAIAGEGWYIDDLTITSDYCCEDPTVGDVDQSGVVDITDVSIVVDNQFLTLTPLVCEAEGDVDFTGVVDITDLSILIDNQFLTLTPLPACP
jgi:hypothetical protein